MVNHISAKQK